MAPSVPPSTQDRAFLPAASLLSQASSATLGPARPGPGVFTPSRGCLCVCVWGGGFQGRLRPLCHVSPRSLGSSGAKPQSPGWCVVKVKVGEMPAPPALQILSVPPLSPGLGARSARHRPCSLASDTGSLDGPPAGVSGRVPRTLARPPYLGCGGIGVSKLRVGHGGRRPGPAGEAGGVLRAVAGGVRPLLRGRRLLGAGRAKQKSGLIHPHAPETFLTQ